VAIYDVRSDFGELNRVHERSHASALAWKPRLRKSSKLISRAQDRYL
jgi:hypothetical protein